MFVGQLQFDWNLAVTVGFQRFSPGQAIEFQQGILINVHVDVNRIYRNDGREEGGCACNAADVIPLRQERPADPSINWREHLGVFEIEPRELEPMLFEIRSGTGHLALRQQA